MYNYNSYHQEQNGKVLTNGRQKEFFTKCINKINNLFCTNWGIANAGMKLVTALSGRVFNKYL